MESPGFPRWRPSSSTGESIPLSGTVNRGTALEQVQFSALGVTLHTPGEGNPPGPPQGSSERWDRCSIPGRGWTGRRDGDTRTSS